MESFNGCVNGNEMVVILKNVYAKVGFIFKAGKSLGKRLKTCNIGDPRLEF